MVSGGGDSILTAQFPEERRGLYGVNIGAESVDIQRFVFFKEAPAFQNGQKGKPCYFNTGVMVIDLGKWRLKNYTEQLEHWMEVQKEKRIYELGSLPPFLLIFTGMVKPVEHRWNQHGLRGDNVIGSCRNLHPGPVSLLHWSGKGKPWLRLDSKKRCPLDNLWAPYDLYVSSSQA